MDYKQFVKIERIACKWRLRLVIADQIFSVGMFEDKGNAEWYAGRLEHALEVLHQKFMDAK